MKGQAPQGILDPILKEAAALAEVALDQLVIVRAESVVWNDGSLGCPEPGMMYTQALVNGYWVVIEAAGRWINSRCASDRCDYVNPAFRARPTSLGARARRAHGTLAEKQRRYGLRY